MFDILAALSYVATRLMTLTFGPVLLTTSTRTPAYHHLIFIRSCSQQLLTIQPAEAKDHELPNLECTKILAARIDTS